MKEKGKGAHLGLLSQITHIEGPALSFKAVRDPPEPSINHSLIQQTCVEHCQCSRCTGEQWYKIQHSRPQTWDPDSVALRDSWNPGDSRAQAGLSAQVSRDTSGLCIGNLDGLFPRALWMFLLDGATRIQLGC